MRHSTACSEKHGSDMDSNKSRRTDVEKVYSYNDFKNKVKAKWAESSDDDTFELKGKELYVNGNLVLAWMRRKSEKSGGKGNFITRLSKENMELLNTWATNVGCTVTNIIETMIEEKKLNGGFPPIDEELGIRYYNEMRDL